MADPTGLRTSWRRHGWGPDRTARAPPIVSASLGVLGVIDIDLLLGNLAGHSLSVLHGLLTNLNLLDADSLLIDNRALFMGHDVLGALGKLGIVSGDLFVKGNALDCLLYTSDAADDLLTV